MRTPALELLERQLAYLDGLSDTEFLFSVGDVLQTLEADPQLAGHLSDLCQEADDLGRELQEAEHDRGAPGQMLEIIWDELGARLPDPQHDQLLKANSRFQSLLGSFEHPVVVPLDPNAGAEDDSRIGQMVHMVVDLDVSEGHAIIDGRRGLFEDLRRRQADVHRRQLRLTRTHPGVALLRLRCLAAAGDDSVGEEAVSCPRSDQAPALAVRANAGGRAWSGLLDSLLAGRVEIANLSAASQLIDGLRSAVSRLGLELRGRIGSVRSRLALINRYKARCEWHDRERLYALAENSAGAREAALRNELALYLFDNGLNPISEAALGSHSRGDVFHPEARDSFLLEAKQYSDGAGLGTALRAAFRQALDTAANLPGSGYEADEVFIVLFRRGGSPSNSSPRSCSCRWFPMVLTPYKYRSSRVRCQPKQGDPEGVHGRGSAGDADR